MIARRQSGMCLVRACRSETQGRFGSRMQTRLSPSTTTLLCPALRPGSTERRRVWPATGARLASLAMCPDLAVSGTAPRPPLLCLQQLYKGRRFNEGELVSERAGGRRPKLPLCYIHHSGPPSSPSSCAREACAKCVPGRVHSTLRGSSLQRLLGLAPRG